MSVLDVFQGDAFSFRSLSAQVDRVEYTPSFLSSLPGLFDFVPVRTEGVWIEERDLGYRLIMTSARGAPPSQESGDKRKVRGFQTKRIADASRVYAHELQGIRVFGSETEVKDIQIEIARRQMKITKNLDVTEENFRLGCVQGIVTDADGSVIYNWFDEFGQAAPTETTFDFSASMTLGDIIKQCNTKRRTMMRNLKGIGGNDIQIHAIVGDDFWDAFVTSPEVRESYKFAMQALQLQNEVGGAWESFRFGKIMWHNYRGTDDNSTVAVGAKKAKFFPSGAGIFKEVYAPAEPGQFTNTPGQRRYSWMVPDRDRNMWADVEVYSYPLHVCTMPQALGSGKIN